jgi:hypothetical protein
MTTNVDLRMSNLQTPEPVQFYALIDGWRPLEAALHNAEYRLQGEWFLKKDALVAKWIDEGCNV